MSGLDLSSVSVGTGWQMFDAMTSSAVSMSPSQASFDTDVAEIVLALSEPIKVLIRVQFLASGRWIHI